MSVIPHSDVFIVLKIYFFVSAFVIHKIKEVKQRQSKDKLETDCKVCRGSPIALSTRLTHFFTELEIMFSSYLCKKIYISFLWINKKQLEKM